MTITTYQIRNVLRRYGNQLKRRTGMTKGCVVPTEPSHDSLDISIETRKRQILSQLSAKLISQVAPRNGRQEEVEEGHEMAHERTRGFAKK